MARTPSPRRSPRRDAPRHRSHGRLQPAALPLVIVPGAPHGPSCRRRDAQRWPVAGEPSTLKLTACDAHGNEVEQEARWGGLLDAPAPPDGATRGGGSRAPAAATSAVASTCTLSRRRRAPASSRSGPSGSWWRRERNRSSCQCRWCRGPPASGIPGRGTRVLPRGGHTGGAFLAPRSFGEGIQGSRARQQPPSPHFAAGRLPDGTSFACDTSARRRGDGDSAIDASCRRPRARGGAGGGGGESPRRPIRSKRRHHASPTPSSIASGCACSRRTRRPNARMHVEVDEARRRRRAFRCDVAPGGAHAASCTVRCEHPSC